MNDLQNILGKLDACKVLGKIDDKTISILSPQGDELQVTFRIKTDYNNLRSKDLTFQAILTVGTADSHAMFIYGAETPADNHAIMNWVNKNVMSIKRAEQDEQNEVQMAVREWLK